MAKRGAAVLEMPGPEYAPENGSRTRGAAGRMRRDPVEDFADEYEQIREPERRRRTATPAPAIKIKLGGVRLPSTVAGMIASGLALLLLLGAVFWLLRVARSFLLHDARFQIADTSAIQIEGNHHLKRAQLLGLFSEDMERNIFGVSLEQRQADLEALPWVRRATVMRLLPGQLRVSLVERTPVAFVRQGGRIALVDAQGVLLDMEPGAQAEHYSFPVVSGITASDPASTRAARMRIFQRFMAELDASGAKNTESLSEVDLSNPEDVKALVEEHGTTVMAHFGEDQFLERFNKVKELLPQWHAQYPNLAAADMRYEHEIPLTMAASAKTPALPLKAAPKPMAPTAVVHTPVPAKAGSKVPTKPAPHAMLKVPTPPMEKAFVPAPAGKPWQAKTPAVQPTVSDVPSVSAAARSAFVAKVPVSAPKAAILPSPKPPVHAAPKPQTPHPTPPAAAKHISGKPAAGKPLDTLHPSQAVQP